MKSHLSTATAALLWLALAASAVAQEPAPSKRKAPESWEPNIAKFEATDRENPPPRGAILFVGSSSIVKWDLSKSFPDRVTLNRGFGGSTLPDSIFHFDRLVPPHQPKAIVIYAGDNDVATGSDAEAVFADFRKLAGLCREKTPGVPVIYIAIKPSIKRWSLWPVQKAANEKIASWCAAHEGFHFADIAAPMLADVEPGQPPKAEWFVADGLHLSDEGYVRWKAVIDPMIDRALAGK